MSADENRQKLISAAIALVHERGVTELTLDDVTTRAGVDYQDGDLRALLFAAMDSISTEFEDAIQQSLSQHYDNTRGALEGIADVYLSKTVGDQAKIALWHSFLGNSDFLRNYKQVFGKEDETFFRVVRTLCLKAMSAGDCERLDATAISHSFIGLLELYWQEISYLGDEFDRDAAKTVVVNFLRGNFPWLYEQSRSANLYSI